MPFSFLQGEMLTPEYSKWPALIVVIGQGFSCMQTCFINPSTVYCPWHVTVSVGMFGCYSFNKSNLTCPNPGKHPNSPLIYWIQQNQSSMWIRGKVQHLWQLYIVLMDTTQKVTSSLQKYFQAYESTWSSCVLAQNSHYLCLMSFCPFKNVR